MPSYHEGYCLPVLEALHAGCQVVASDAGNLPAIVAGLGQTRRGRGTSRHSRRPCVGRSARRVHSVQANEAARVPTAAGEMPLDEWLEAVARHVERHSRERYDHAFLRILQGIGVELEDDSGACRRDMTPRVSIVISTLNRAESLRRTLLSLRQLDYPEFEVVVVVGPSTDHTDAVVSEFGDEIKVGRTRRAEPLGVSERRHPALLGGARRVHRRRLGAGSVVAERRRAARFEDGEVAAAGGPVYDFDGASLFSRYSLVDIHGDTMIWRNGPNPSRALAAPLSNLVVYPIGTNAVFRRSVLVALGGFDEELGHYFDDADIGRRVVDSGLGRARRASAGSSTTSGSRARPGRRSGSRETCTRTSGAEPTSRFGTVAPRRARRGRQTLRADRRALPRRPPLVPGSRLASRPTTWRDSSATRSARPTTEWKALCESPGSASPRGSTMPARSFAPSAGRVPARRLHVCIVSQEYLPKQLNGIGRLSHELAIALAERGHVVRILTEAEEHDSVELENGVWVHRVVARPATSARGHRAPRRGSGTSRRASSGSCAGSTTLTPVDIVQMPNWNSEGIAVLEDGGFTSILGLHTPLETIARIDPRVDPQHPEVRQLLALERRCYERRRHSSPVGPRACSQVEDEYGIELPRNRIGFVPFGIRDRRNPSPLSCPGSVNVLFVGRLEARKGIDTLLDAVAILLRRDARRRVHDRRERLASSASPAAPTARSSSARRRCRSREGRVFFRGVVPDEELDRYYAGCDVFVAPSRSESFGLILLEAMREAKPVIAGDVGGMREVVEHEGNGLLVPPGDASAFADALRRLVTSPSLRERFGRRSRELFVERFTAARMAEGYERFCTKLLGARVAR